MIRKLLCLIGYHRWVAQVSRDDEGGIVINRHTRWECEYCGMDS
jgi:hypothetical protein